MDPLSIITTALVTGAAAAATDTASQVIKDAYNHFKALLVRKFGAGVSAAADVAEKLPGSDTAKTTTQAILSGTNAEQDTEVLDLAKTLIAALEKHASQQQIMSNTSTNNAGINIQGSTVSGPVTQNTHSGNTSNSGSGAIAQGHGAKAVGAGGVMVDGDVGGSINTGHIDTGGGPFVGGDLNTGGGDFVGRDHKVVNNYYGRNPTESASTQFSEIGHKLYDVLKDKWFSDSDLQDLCFQLDIDWDALDGGNKIDKARSLVLECEKGGKLPKLLSIVRLARPHLKDQLS